MNTAIMAKSAANSMRHIVAACSEPYAAPHDLESTVNMRSTCGTKNEKKGNRQLRNRRLPLCYLEFADESSIRHVMRKFREDRSLKRQPTKPIPASNIAQDSGSGTGDKISGLAAK